MAEDRPAHWQRRGVTAAYRITRRSQPTPAPESRFYTVKSGDTMSKIAKEVYGDANAYQKIFVANQPMLTDPNKIFPGQVLRVPA